MKFSLPVVTLVIAFAGSEVHALPLLAGQTVAPSLTSSSLGTMGGWENVTAFDFKIVSAAFRNSSGNWDFYYQVTKSAASTLTGSLAFGVDNYGEDASRPNLLADVNYRMDGGSFPTIVGFPQFPGFVGGSVAPLSASRSADGDLISFDFGSLLLPGSTSFVFGISTQQGNYSGAPMFTFEDGVSTFQTLVVGLPEHNLVPDAGSTLLLLLAGLGSAFGLRSILCRVR